MSAPRPLPKPERAIASEASGTESQRKQQSAKQRPNRTTAPSVMSRSLERGSCIVSEKQLKKVLTLSIEIVYHGGRFKIEKGLLPGRVPLSVRIPVTDKNNPNTTGKEKEHIHAFIESS
jgi:hypothetical protein